MTPAGARRIVGTGCLLVLLSIADTKVVFRKTQERGFPLMKPKDITKEINPEGR